MKLAKDIKVGDFLHFDMAGPLGIDDIVTEVTVAETYVDVTVESGFDFFFLPDMELEEADPSLLE